MVEENFVSKGYCFNIGMDGITSLDGSLVNADEKKEASTYAFLLSVVADNLMLSSEYAGSHIPALVLVLD